MADQSEQEVKRPANSTLADDASGADFADDRLEQFQYLPEPLPEEVVLQWQAPSRPYKIRSRQYYLTIFLLVFLISLILFFAGQMLPIAVVIAVAFLAYVVSAVPPETITNKITNYGIRIDRELYFWEELGRFWYEERFKQPILHIEVARFPNQLTLLLGEMPQNELSKILSQVLIEEKPEPTAFDKAVDWLQKKFPLEIE